MPTLAGDKQMVLPTDTVMYQAQEVAAVVATTRYAAADGVAAVLVDYEPLPVIVDPFKALEPDAFVLRPDRGPDKQNNHIWHWESGDQAATDAALAAADVTVVSEDIYIPRIHVASIETCGCVADWDAVREQLTLHMTSQAPHAIRTVLALVAAGRLPIRAEHPGQDPRHRRRVRRQGAGLPGLRPRRRRLASRPASRSSGSRTARRTSRPTRSPATTTSTPSWARRRTARSPALKVKTIADHGYTDAAADPSKFPAGLFNVITGSYDFPNAFVEVDGVYTNKPPGGVAYRCSFRVTEAVHAIERMVDILAHEIGKDPAQLRMENFIQPEQFPYKTPTGWEYDSGNYPAALQKAMDMIDYAGLRREQAEKRARGELMGIGISIFTEIVGAGPSHDFDILGHQDVRLVRDPGPPDRQGPRPDRRPDPGPGPRDDVRPDHRRGARLPGRRHQDRVRRHRHGAVRARARTPRARRRSPARPPRWRRARSRTRPASSPPTCSRPPRTTSSGRTASSASRARRTGSRRSRRSPSRPTPTIPQGMETGLEAVDYYDPPNLTFPFGSYICVVDIDKGTGQVNVRRFVAVDDCGNIINPMIVDGQIHGGLTMGLAPALYEEITYDEHGNNLAGTFMDYLLPTAVETPAWEIGKTITPSPHHPIGAKGVGESATVGAPPAIANAVVDALWHLGVRNIDIPITPPEGLGDPPREGGAPRAARSPSPGRCA